MNSAPFTYCTDSKWHLVSQLAILDLKKQKPLFATTISPLWSKKGKRKALLKLSPCSELYIPKWFLTFVVIVYFRTRQETIKLPVFDARMDLSNEFPSELEISPPHAKMSNQEAAFHPVLFTLLRAKFDGFRSTSPAFGRAFFHLSTSIAAQSCSNVLKISAF